MRPHPPTLVIFDLMDTVVRDPFFVYVPRALGCSMTEAFERLNAEAWVQFEEGRIDEAEFLRTMFREQGDSYPTSLRLHLRDVIVNNYTFVRGMRSLLKDLQRRQYPSWLLSNYPCWFDGLWDRLNLAQFFEGAVVSFRERIRKPDRRAFLLLCERAQVAPAACLFIDNSVGNVAAAADVGMQTHHFTGVGTLREWLAGVIPRQGLPRSGER